MHMNDITKMWSRPGILGDGMMDIIIVVDNGDGVHSAYNDITAFRRCRIIGGETMSTHTQNESNHDVCPNGDNTGGTLAYGDDEGVH